MPRIDGTPFNGALGVVGAVLPFERLGLVLLAHRLVCDG